MLDAIQQLAPIAQIVAQLVLLSVALAVATFPFVWRFFKGSAIAVAILSIFLSTVLVSLISFIVVSIGVVDLSKGVFWVVLAGLTVFSWLGIRQSWKDFRIWIRNAKLTLLNALALFASLLSVFLILKGHAPEIYQIERFMDFGFIAALENSSTLPLNDIWLSGEDLNYYYLGHMIGYVLISLGRLPIEPGFFAVQAWLFAMLFMAVFAAALEYTRFVLPKKLNRKQLNFALLSAWATVFAGGLYSALQLAKSTFGETSEDYWYAIPARIIEGTITEYPVFSFIASDLHAHTWGLLFAAVAMLFAAMLVRTYEAEGSFVLRRFIPHLVIASVLVATAFMTNAWDVVTVGGLISLTMLRSTWRFLGFKSIGLVALLGAISFGISLFWYWPYEPPLSGIGIVGERSDPWQWLQFWFLPFSFLVGVIVVRYQDIIAWLKNVYGSIFEYRDVVGVFKGASKAINLGISCVQPIVIPVLLSVGLWIMMELIFFEDILTQGEWFRANTVFKVTSQAWVFLGVAVGPLAAMIWNERSKLTSKIVIGLLGVVVLLSSVYPFRALPQGLLQEEWQGIDSGFSWIERQYPDDFALIRELQQRVSEQSRSERQELVLLEAEGESYGDNARISVALGLPTVIGYPIHEWTWRGSYDEVGARRADVVRVYSSSSLEEVESVLATYEVDFVVLGELEMATYPELVDGSAAILQLEGVETIQAGSSKAILLNTSF